MNTFADSLKTRGVHLASSRSARSPTGRASNPRWQAQCRGRPLCRGQELIGGFFLLDVATHEQAVAIAGECPAAEWASIEVREVARAPDEQHQTQYLTDGITSHICATVRKDPGAIPAHSHRSISPNTMSRDR